MFEAASLRPLTTTKRIEIKTNSSRNTTSSGVKLNKPVDNLLKSNNVTIKSTTPITISKSNSTSFTTTEKNILKNPDTKSHLKRILTISKNKHPAEPKKIPETISPFDEFYDRSLAIFNRQKKSHFMKKRVHDEHLKEGHRSLSKGR